MIDFSSLSIMQLKECYKKRNIKGFSKWKRDKLREKLVVWQGAWNKANATIIVKR
jgi:hypothetical protein